MTAKIFQTKRQKNIFIGVCGALAAVVLLLMSILLFVPNSLGITGTYVYEVDGRISFSMTLNIDNTLEYRTYTYDEAGQSTSVVSPDFVKWVRHYDRNASSGESGIPQHHIRICDSTLQTVWFMYDFVDEKYLYLEYDYRTPVVEEICLVKQ